MYHRLFRMVMEEGPLAPLQVPIAFPFQIYGMSKALNGFDLYAVPFPMLRYMWLDQ